MLQELVKQVIMRHLFNRSGEPSYEESTFCSGEPVLPGNGPAGGMSIGKLWSRVGVLEKKLKMREKECETVWNDYQQLLEQTYTGSGNLGARGQW